MSTNTECNTLADNITDDHLTNNPDLISALKHIKTLTDNKLKVYLIARIIKEAKIEGKSDLYNKCAKNLPGINDKCDYKLYECYLILSSVYNNDNELIKTLKDLFKNFPFMTFSMKVFAYLLIYNGLEEEKILQPSDIKQQMETTNNFNKLISDTDIRQKYDNLFKNNQDDAVNKAFKESVKNFFDNNLIIKKCTPKSFNEFYTDAINKHLPKPITQDKLDKLDNDIQALAAAQAAAQVAPVASPVASPSGQLPSGQAAAQPTGRIATAIANDVANNTLKYNTHNIAPDNIAKLDDAYDAYDAVVPQGTGTGTAQGQALDDQKKGEVIGVINLQTNNHISLKVIWLEFLRKILEAEVVYDSGNNELKDNEALILEEFLKKRKNINTDIGATYPPKIEITFDKNTKEITIDSGTPTKFDKNNKATILPAIDGIVNDPNVFGGYNNKQGNLTYYLCSSSVKISLKRVQAKSAREAAKMVAKKVLKGKKSVKFSLKRMIGKKEKYYNYQASIDKSGKISIKST
jgi:hypothetical protein